MPKILLYCILAPKKKKIPKKLLSQHSVQCVPKNFEETGTPVVRNNKKQKIQQNSDTGHVRCIQPLQLISLLFTEA